MKAEEFVNNHYGHTFHEKQVRNNKEIYYIIWRLDENKRRVRVGIGDTISKAYTDAKTEIIDSLRNVL